MYSRRETLCFISFWANLTRSDSLSGTSAFMNTNCSCELLRIRPSQLQNKIYVSKLLTGWLSSMGFSSPKPSAWRFRIASKAPVFHPRLLNFLPAHKSETFSTLPGKVRQNASFVSFSFASAVPWVGAAVSYLHRGSGCNVTMWHYHFALWVVHFRVQITSLCTLTPVPSIIPRGIVQAE